MQPGSENIRPAEGPIELAPDGDWHGLYRGNTSKDPDLYTAESVRHPAKMSLPLLRRIIAELLACGWLKLGDVLLDEFGGRGSTGLEWCALHPSNRAVTVELERPFIRMAEDCKALASQSLGYPFQWEILRGDSRYLDQYLQGDFSRVRELERGEIRAEYEAKIDALAKEHPEHQLTWAKELEAEYDRTLLEYTYTPDRALFGGLPAIGSISSPPYGKGVIGQSNEKAAERLRKLTEDPGSSLYGRDPNGAWFHAMIAGYHNSPGNIDLLPADGDLVAASSPPYQGKRDSGGDGYKHVGRCSEGAGVQFAGGSSYGEAPVQIGSLKDPDADYAASIGSPPFIPARAEPNYSAERLERASGPCADRACSGMGQRTNGYGDTPGQIAALKDDVDEALSAIGSPPYLDNLSQCDRTKGFRSQGENAAKNRVKQDYIQPTSPLNIGRATDDVDQALAHASVGSPPYEESLSGDDPEKRGGLFRDPKRAGDRSLTANYLIEGGVSSIASAPYEAQSGGHPISENGPLADPRLHERHAASKINSATGYGRNTEGQIGTKKGPTYASACLEVYQAMYRANVRYAVLVTKNPVKNQELRRLDLLTIRLMDEAGYELVAQRRAWLWETVRQLRERGAPVPEKFGEKVAEAFRGREDEIPVGRISFFNILHMLRGRRPPAQWEDVMFFRRK